MVLHYCCVGLCPELSFLSEVTDLAVQQSRALHHTSCVDTNAGDGDRKSPKWTG